MAEAKTLLKLLEWRDIDDAGDDQFRSSKT